MVCDLVAPKQHLEKLCLAILKEAKQKMIRERNAVMCKALQILLLLVMLKRLELEF